MSAHASKVSDPHSDPARISNTQAAELCADGLISVPDAARFLGVCRAEVYLQMNRGNLPSAKIGKRRLIPRRAVVDMAAKAVIATQQQA